MRAILTARVAIGLAAFALIAGGCQSTKEAGPGKPVAENPAKPEKPVKPSACKFESNLAAYKQILDRIGDKPEQMNEADKAALAAIAKQTGEGALEVSSDINRQIDCYALSVRAHVALADLAKAQPLAEQGFNSCDQAVKQNKLSSGRDCATLALYRGLPAGDAIAQQAANAAKGPAPAPVEVWKEIGRVSASFAEHAEAGWKQISEAILSLPGAGPEAEKESRAARTNVWCRFAKPISSTRLWSTRDAAEENAKIAALASFRDAAIAVHDGLPLPAPAGCSGDACADAKARAAIAVCLAR